MIGRDHQLHGRNGQDHGVARSTGRLAVAVVADGCGEARGSELGARTSAVVAARVATAMLASGAELDALVEGVGREAKRVLRAIAVEIAGDDAAAFASAHLAATLLVAAARDDDAMVFGWGDGLYRIDDRVVSVDEAGRPGYLANELWAEELPVCSFVGRAERARCVAVATDGFDERALAELPVDRSSALLRWMRIRARAGSFSDDGAVGLLAPSCADRSAR